MPSIFLYVVTYSVPNMTLTLDRSPNFGDSDKNGLDATLSMKLSTLRLQRMNRLKLVSRSPEHHWPSEEECSSLYDLLKLFDWNCYKMCRENIDMTPMLDGTTIFHFTVRFCSANHC